MTASLSSLYGAGAQLFDDKGVVLSGGLIYTYLAGSTTPAITWTDSAQTVPNANPIQLNSAGRTTSEIYLPNGTGYKFIVTDSLGASVGPTWDNIFSLGTNAGGTSSASAWVESGLVPTFSSSTSFTVPGNQTLVFPVGTRIKTTNTAGTIYATVIAVAFTSSTLVTVKTDAGILDAGLNDVAYSLISGQAYYARGPFTPVLKFAGVTQTTSVTQGEYIQLSNVILFTIRLGKTNSGSPSGAVTIGGLPFASSASFTYIQNAALVTPNWPTGMTGMHGEIAGGDIQLYYNTTSGMSNVLDAAINSNTGSTNIYVSGVYFLS